MVEAASVVTHWVEGNGHPDTAYAPPYQQVQKCRSADCTCPQTQNNHPFTMNDAKTLQYHIEVHAVAFIQGGQNEAIILQGNISLTFDRHLATCSVAYLNKE